MTLVLLLRLAKLVGVVAFAMGIALALAPIGDEALRAANQRVRQRAAHWLATPGFIVTWIAGWGIARHYGISLGRPWISVSMLASLIALHEVIRDAEPDRPRSKVRLAVILIALLVSLASMVVRDG